MRRAILALFATLALCLPASAQSAQSKADLLNSLAQTIVNCASGQKGCIHPSQVQALLNALISSACMTNSASDCVLPSGSAASNLGMDATLRADLAYQSFVNRFWTGTQTGGHFMVINGNSISGPAANPPVETTFIKPWLWQAGIVTTIPYVKWKVTGDLDAKARIQAEWAWMQTIWSASDLSVCNSVGGQSATTLDDSNWVVRGLVEIYEITLDANALTYAKNMLDCMNGASGFYDYALSGSLATHWYDATPATASWSGGVLTVTLSRAAAVPVSGPDTNFPGGHYFNISGFSNATINNTWQAQSVSGNVITVSMPINPGAISGGGWYHSGQGKGMDSLPFALAELAYYNAACPLDGASCPTKTGYFTAAKNELDWANATIDRSVNSNCPQSDHTYWAGVGYGTPPMPMDTNGTFCTRANNIGLAGSDVGLWEDMAGATANALMYAATHTISYQAQAQNVAASILALEIDTCGAFLDDRDARVGGSASYDFATNVFPLLSTQTKSQMKSAYLATSLATVQRNRNITGTFGGDWCGPWNGVYTKQGFHPDQIEISAEPVIISIVAAGL